MQKKGTPQAAVQSNRTITMRDVAREADVSLGTVSRVVNKHPAVKPAIRQRVEAAIAQTGWQPNVVAQSMRTASTKMIGCVLPDTSNPLFVSIAKGAEEVLRAHGYAFVLANSNSDGERDLELLKLLMQRRVDGLLFAPSDEYDPRIVSLLERSRTPTVLVERELPIDCDYVVSNQCSGIRQAVEYLLSIGHTRIALVTGQQRIRPGRERYKGFVEAFENAGLAFDPTLVRLDSMDAAYAYREVQRLMELQKPPTAIIMGGNLMLPGALRACVLKEIKVPQDVSIVAVGETDLAELASPPITTVRWNLEALGREAASIVMDRITRKPSTEKRESRHVVVPTEIVLRRSCAPLK